MNDSCVVREIETESASMRFAPRPETRERFWMAETRSRTTKAVKVYRTEHRQHVENARDSAELTSVCSRLLRPLSSNAHR